MLLLSSCLLKSDNLQSFPSHSISGLPVEAANNSFRVNSSVSSGPWGPIAALAIVNTCSRKKAKVIDGQRFISRLGGPADDFRGSFYVVASLWDRMIG